MSEQKFYLVRDGAGTFDGAKPLKLSIRMVKDKPDPSKFKFLRINPNNSHVEEWVANEEYDNLVKHYEKDTK